MGKWTSRLGYAARMAGVVATRIVLSIVLFGAVGFVINLGCVALLSPEVAHLSREVGGSPAARVAGGGGPFAVFMLVILAAAYWKPLGLVLLFGLALPIAYVACGQKHGIERAVIEVLRRHKPIALRYLFERLAEYVAKHPEWSARINQSGLRTTLNELLPVYLARLDNLPRVLKWTFRRLVERVDFRGIVVRAVETRHIQEFDADKIVPAMVEVADEFLDEKFFQVSYKLLLGLVLANFALVTVFKLVLAP